jgi:glycosyltransferase involved in cell wall biosynthesis
MKNLKIKSLLIVNNSGFVKSKNNFFLFKKTVDFINDICNSSFYDDVGVVQVSLSQINDKNMSQKSLNDCHNLNIYHSPFNEKSFFNKCISYFRSIFTILITVFKYDFIYVFFPGNFNSIILFFSILLNKKFGLYIRNEFELNFINKIYLKKAKFIISTGEVTRRKVRPYNESCELISPMVDFKLSDIKNSAPKKASDVFKILYVSRLEGSKGVFNLIEMIRLFKKSKINIFVDIIGSGPDFDKTRYLVNKYELNENCKLHGFISDFERLKKFYSTADLFLFPTKYPEGFPRVLYEAMAFNCPIMTYFIGDISGLLSDKVNCIELKETSPNYLYQMVKNNMTNYELLNNISLMANKDIQEVLSTRNIAHYEQVNHLINKFI